MLQTGKCFAAFVAACAFTTIIGARDGGDNTASDPAHRNRYRIEIDLDYQGAKLNGRETVKYSNMSREDVDSLTFHLYPNFGLTEEDQPSLLVHRITATRQELQFEPQSHQATIRVDLPQKLRPGQRIELTLEFSGRIPRVQREETSLLAHFLLEINDALSDERQLRDARDIFFAGEEAMMLGYFFPVLAPRQIQGVDQNLAVGVGNVISSDIADYEVAITTADGLTLIASADCVESRSVEPASGSAANRTVHRFRGDKLRGFSVAVVERMASVEQKVGDVRVVSYYRESDERIGKGVLNIALKALETYRQSIGEYPYPLLQVVELPLAAGYSSIQLPSMVAVAQAYYIDFDAPQAARLPGVLREQSDIIKSSFEFTIAYSIAKQWWGEAVGGDPERAPYLEESLANFSAAYYHEAAYGKKLGDLIIDQQLRGAYQAHRMLGGVDMEVDKPLKDFRNALQYTAIVQAKGALLFVALRRKLGDERFFNALRNYYSAHRHRIATPDHLRYAFMSVAENPRDIRPIFQRWLREKRGDEDIGTPDLTLIPPPVSKIRALGRVFVKIGRTAAKPF
jgi:hypothetical protein